MIRGINKSYAVTGRKFQVATLVRYDKFDQNQQHYVCLAASRYWNPHERLSLQTIDFQRYHSAERKLRGGVPKDANDQSIGKTNTLPSQDEGKFSDRLTLTRDLGR